jgi:hypothetical protein
MTSLTLLADQAIDPDRMMLAGVDTATEGPLFSVSEMAQFFFARSAHWGRWLDTCHYTGPGETRQCTYAPGAHDPSASDYEDHKATWKLVLDGELLQPLRTSSNARQYDLALIEKIAHALASNQTIKASQLRQALTLVRIQAQMHGYL